MRPPSLFGKYGQADRTAHDAKPADVQLKENQLLPSELPDYCLKPIVSAGDFIIMPEATVHGVIPWRTKDRIRRTLILRHGLQEKGFATAEDPQYRVTPGLRARIAAPTVELMTLASAETVKEITRMDAATLERLLTQPPVEDAGGLSAESAMFYRADFRILR